MKAPLEDSLMALIFLGVGLVLSPGGVVHADPHSTSLSTGVIPQETFHKQSVHGPDSIQSVSAEYLIRHLRAGGDWRSEAEELLRRIENEGEVRHLAEIQRMAFDGMDSDEAREAAFFVLGRLPLRMMGEQYFAVVENTDESTRVRSAAIRAMGQTFEGNQRPHWIGRLKAVFEREAKGERANQLALKKEIFLAIGRMGGPEAFDFLKPFLSSRSFSNFSSALSGLVETHDPRTSGELITVYRRLDKKKLRENASSLALIVENLGQIYSDDPQEIYAFLLEVAVAYQKFISTVADLGEWNRHQNGYSYYWHHRVGKSVLIQAIAQSGDPRFARILEKLGHYRLIGGDLVVNALQALDDLGVYPRARRYTNWLTFLEAYHPPMTSIGRASREIALRRSNALLAEMAKNGEKLEDDLAERTTVEVSFELKMLLSQAATGGTEHLSRQRLFGPTEPLIPLFRDSSASRSLFEAIRNFELLETTLGLISGQTEASSKQAVQDAKDLIDLFQ